MLQTSLVCDVKKPCLKHEEALFENHALHARPTTLRETQKKARCAGARASAFALWIKCCFVVDKAPLVVNNDVNILNISVKLSTLLLFIS